MKLYDMIIIGGGPGGYTAALYAARAGLQVLVIERLAAGGQMALTHKIDNYPGYPEGIDGWTLSENMQKQAHSFGAKTVYAEVKAVNLLEEPKQVQTADQIYFAKTVVISTGADCRKLGLEAEQRLTGRGVSYCATCDGMFYRQKTVVIVGGGNTAVADALLLSRVAQKVILVHRRDNLRATRVYHKSLEEAPNIELVLNSEVTQLLGEERLSGVVVKNVLTGEIRQISADGLFIAIGRQPATKLFSGQLELDENGYILAGEDTKTSLPGVYAVGDVRSKPVRQIVTATADGAIAVHMAEAFLSQ